MNNYYSKGKGPCKEEKGFEYYKTKEKGIVNYIKYLMDKECEKNVKKLDNNLKLAQADINGINNMKRVVDEKERVNVEKIKRFENDNIQLESEITELKEILDKKKNILKNIKKRNEQSKNNRKKLNEMNYSYNKNGSPDIILNESLNEENTNKYGNSNNDQKKYKRHKETGCECIIL